MNEFESQVLSALNELKSEMNLNFSKVNSRLDNLESDVSGINKRLEHLESDVSNIKEDIEIIKEEAEITRAAANDNGEKLEELILAEKNNQVHNYE